MYNMTRRKIIKQVLNFNLEFQGKRSLLYCIRLCYAGKGGVNHKRGAMLVTHTKKQTPNYLIKKVGVILGVGVLAVSLSGCGAGDAISNLSMAITGNDTKGIEKQNTSSTVNNNLKIKAPIAFAPVFGPPVKVAQKLSGALESEAQVRSIKVLKGKSVKPEYTVRGYLSASPTKNGTKLSYIWDVTNPAGKRAHRIKGEEIVVSANQNPKDPWATVDQVAIQTIASKTATKLANWLPSGNPSSSNLLRQASLKSEQEKYSGPVIASIPRIKGAPGDGGKSLAKALKQQLKVRNIKLASAGDSKTFKVIGLVNLTAPVQGKQNIKIQWVVRDPNNKKLGTVSQKTQFLQDLLTENGEKQLLLQLLLQLKELLNC